MGVDGISSAKNLAVILATNRLLKSGESFALKTPSFKFRQAPASSGSGGMVIGDDELGPVSRDSIHPHPSGHPRAGWVMPLDVGDYKHQPEDANDAGVANPGNIAPDPSAFRKLAAYTALGYAENVRFVTDVIPWAVAEGGARLGAKLFGTQRSQHDKDVLASYFNTAGQVMQWGWGKLTKGLPYSEYTNPTMPQNRKLWWMGMGACIALPVLGTIAVMNAGKVHNAARWALREAKTFVKDDAAFVGRRVQDAGRFAGRISPRGLFPELAFSDPNAIFSAGKENISILEKLLRPKSLNFFKKSELGALGKKLAGVNVFTQAGRHQLIAHMKWVSFRLRTLGFRKTVRITDKLFGDSKFRGERLLQAWGDRLITELKLKHWKGGESSAARYFFKRTHEFIGNLKYTEKFCRNYAGFRDNTEANDVILKFIELHILGIEKINEGIEVLARNDKLLWDANLGADTLQLRGVHNNLKRILAKRDFAEADNIIKTIADLLEEQRRSPYLSMVQRDYKS